MKCLQTVNKTCTTGRNHFSFFFSEKEENIVGKEELKTLKYVVLERVDNVYKPMAKVTESFFSYRTRGELQAVSVHKIIQ